MSELSKRINSIKDIVNKLKNNIGPKHEDVNYFTRFKSNTERNPYIPLKIVSDHNGDNICRVQIDLNHHVLTYNLFLNVLLKDKTDLLVFRFHSFDPKVSSRSGIVPIIKSDLIVFTGSALFEYDKDNKNYLLTIHNNGKTFDVGEYFIMFSLGIINDELSDDTD